ncbi:recombinase family protein [Halalkalibacter kiskunsagensis]|uniref:Recombinase family protein n=1 Tax=Halalkalibacter kiskunsagensis TaxID=1548599 RepID=A0ABV6KD63_9BACI
MSTSSKKINHVAKYLRISQEKKSENFETLSNHRALLSEFAKDNGYTYETYEEVLSGGASDLDQRPQLQKLLNEIEKFDAILVVELSRLSRNGLISETVLQYCKDYDKPIITPEKLYDLANNDNDVLTFRFGSLIASQEHALIGKRSKYNKIQMAKAGLYITGVVPFGYIRNSLTKKLEIDEENAKTIRYIFKLHSEGLGSYKIRDILNAEGYKSATGKHFNLPSIKRIIQNPVYKGWTVFNDRKKVKKNGKFTYETVETIISKDTHPPIVEASLWNEVNKDREERAKRSTFSREKPAVKTGVTMLKDLIYCSECGRKMTVRKDNKLKMYTIKKCEYLTDEGEKCGNAGIKLDHVEKNVMMHLQKYKVELEEYLQTLNSEASSIVETEQKNRLNQLEKQKKELESQNSKLIDLALSGIFTHDELKEKKQRLTDELTYLERQRENLLFEMNHVSVEDMQTQIEGTLEKIETVEIKDNPEALNATLKTMIKKIHYSRVIPKDLLMKSTQNPERKNYPFELKIEYF